jgi:flagellar basal-body rod modification protein FlgD
MANNLLWSNIGDVPVSETNAWAAMSRQPNNELDRQAFLNLLMTQLKFQDPLNPMDDRDFMAQMAQFSALEQMVNLNQTFERSHAFTMIGREVEFGFRHPQSGEWIDSYGLVQAVTMQGSDVFLLVDGMDVPVTGVRGVGDSPDNTMNNVLSSINQARVQDMVGRTVQALVHNSRGEVTDFVEGVVDYVKISGNQSVLVIGNREVFPWEVATVSNGPILLGTTNFTNGDTLTGVEIRGTRAYLVFQNDTDDEALRTVRVHVERVNYAMEAIQFINQYIQHVNVAGTVQSVTIRNGIPFLNVRTEAADGTYTMHEVNYRQYLADRIAARNAPAAQGDTP